MKRIDGPLAALKLGQIIAYDCMISDTALRVYSLIAVHVDKDGKCWPSLSKIGAKFGVSRQAIGRQVDELVLHNYLTKTADFDESSGRRKTNVYRLNFQLANDFQNETDIFSKANISKLLVYLVMLFKYPPQPLEVTGDVTHKDCEGMQPLEVTGYATPGGCINIPDEHNHVKESEEATSALITKNKEEPLVTTPLQSQMLTELEAEVRAFFNDLKINASKAHIYRAIRERDLDDYDAAELMIEHMQELVDYQNSLEEKPIISEGCI